MGFLGHRNCFICLFIYFSIIFETRAFGEAQAGLGFEAILSRLGLPNAAITGASQYAQPTLFFFYTMGAKKLPSQEASPPPPLPNKQQRVSFKPTDAQRLCGRQH